MHRSQQHVQASSQEDQKCKAKGYQSHVFGKATEHSKEQEPYEKSYEQGEFYDIVAVGQRELVSQLLSTEECISHILVSRSAKCPNLIYLRFSLIRARPWSAIRP